MNTRSIRMTLLTAVVLTTPVLTFAGGQPAKGLVAYKQVTQDRTGIARAVQQGKGSGNSQSQAVIRANAYRAETVADRQPVRTQPATQADTAFRK